MEDLKRDPRVQDKIEEIKVTEIEEEEPKKKKKREEPIATPVQRFRTTINHGHYPAGTEVELVQMKVASAIIKFPDGAIDQVPPNYIGRV
jgi:hypothetical protein